jgi:hypothetical protein
MKIPLFPCRSRNRNSQETRLGAGKQTNGVSISSRSLHFLFSQISKSALGSSHPPTNGYREIFPRRNANGAQSRLPHLVQWLWITGAALHYPMCLHDAHMSSWHHVQAQGWTDMAKKDSPNISRVKTIYSTIYSPSLTVSIKQIFYRKYLKI